jgi:hypothetical protein
MSKHKKKHAKKSADDLFDTAADSVRKFRKVTREISKLSTGQKVVGGLALLAGGLLYLNKLKDELADEPAPASRLLLPPRGVEAPARGSKAPKSPKARKATPASAPAAE